MDIKKSAFAEEHVLHNLKHYLPSQAPLKDFVHHNTLHAFQHLNFIDGLNQATEIFGFNTFLTLIEYHDLYGKNEINDKILNNVIIKYKGANCLVEWKEKMLNKSIQPTCDIRIGKLRAYWKDSFRIDLDNQIQPLLFRILCSYLDQGIAIDNFPIEHKGFLSSLRELERNSHVSFFKTERARNLLLHSQCKLPALLHIVVGDEMWFENYLFDQQFSHPGWSGLVATIEDQPETLLDKRNITLHDFIAFELLLEIDALTFYLGNNWKPISEKVEMAPTSLFAAIDKSEYQELVNMWQEAYEWTYYDSILCAVKQNSIPSTKSISIKDKSFQALFCIDDRECSIRRHVEQLNNKCETFGTPGHFGVEFYYQPEHGKFLTKSCPVPITPKFLIKEYDSSRTIDKDVHLSKHSHNLVTGWLISQTLGFWSALRLCVNLFKPSMSPATATSLRHMEKLSKLTVEYHPNQPNLHNLQVGFSQIEMANRLEAVLKSIGLIHDFAPIVYVIGHGSSSVNNPHYAAYDCGACSGRPGSVNARVFCQMANNTEVREILKIAGINIPVNTVFIAALHDTTRDEMVFYDEENLREKHIYLHRENKHTFNNALDENARERSRRFEVVNTKKPAKYVHEKIKTRSVSLFEPRPELNHATNSLCIIGRREITHGIFLDRRAFMNSYDYKIDPEGKWLLNILKAAAPVCGGINLEYYFSRVDNQKLGAGSKLPHNVMGLVGVANGIDGDIRPGLPSQMIEVHNPIRLLMVIEHLPDVVKQTLDQSSETSAWFENEWINLVVVNPENGEFFRYNKGRFDTYEPFEIKIPKADKMYELILSSGENIPVHLIGA